MIKMCMKPYIVNHIRPFSLHYNILPWVTLKGQTKVIVF